MIDRRGFLGGLLAIPSVMREMVRKIAENQVPISGDLIYQWKVPVMWTTEMLEDAAVDIRPMIQEMKVAKGIHSLDEMRRMR